MTAENIFSDLYLREDLSDVRVVVENSMRRCSFPAHSLVLKRASPVFRNMLESDFAEGQSKIITITDFKANQVKHLLKFLYKDTLPETYASVRELTKLADKYLVKSLKEKCEKTLQGFVNLQNVYELCDLSEMYSLDKLRGECLHFMKRAAFKLLDFDELESLSEEFMKDIVSADNLNIYSETEVFWVIWKWGSLQVNSTDGENSDENIREVIKDLLKHVRWSLINEHNLENIISSSGITVDDSDLQKECEPRKPHSTYLLSFLNQCDVLNLNTFSSSCTFVEDAGQSPLNLLRFTSLADTSFYVVGVLLTCTADLIGESLKCWCGPTSSVANISDSHSQKFNIDSVVYHEVMCEFVKPIVAVKSATFEIRLVRKSPGNFGGVVMKFRQYRNLIWRDMGSALHMEGNVYGISKLFILPV